MSNPHDQKVPSIRVSFFIPKADYRRLQMHAIMKDKKLLAFIREVLTDASNRPLIEK